MTKFVIRSMSTTDFCQYTRKPVVPFHIYLRRPEARKGAFWSHLGEAQRFDSIEEAQAEIARCNFWRASPASYGPDIVPEDHRDLPTFWERQAAHDSIRRRLRERLAS